MGGIEYIVVDGVTWLFGFNYSDDLVLSPLFDEPHEMAAFAAAHMRQLTRGGPDVVHDAAYWAELIEDSEGESGLADPENCVFTPEALQALPAWTGSVRDSNRIAAPLAFEYHLSYLLNAAIGEDRTVELTALQELDRLGLDYQPDEVGTQCLAQCRDGLGDADVAGRDTARDQATDPAARHVAAADEGSAAGDVLHRIHASSRVGGRAPNSAVPTRTMVAPSSMAGSMSSLIPIDSVSTCG